MTPLIQGVLLGLQVGLELIKAYREHRAAKGAKLCPEEKKAIKAKMLAAAKEAGNGIPSKPVSKEPVELKP